MNYILSFLLFFSSFVPNFLVEHTIQNSCETATQQAKDDHAKNKLKYYTFGIASFPAAQAKKMYKEYQIEVISLGCMVDPDKVCYNQYVDNILIVKTGKDFYSLGMKEPRD